MKKYKYKNPEDCGYKKTKISRKDYNRIFTKNPTKWYYSYCFFYNEQNFIIEKYNNVLAKIVIILMLPLTFLKSGLIVIFEELPKALFQKKYGTFSKDIVWNQDKPDSAYKKMIEVKKD